MRELIGIIVVLLVAEIGVAQDPGIPDTVRFGKWGVYLPCPPCSGIATVPIFIFNDEFLTEMKFYFQCAGPVGFSKIEFSSEIDSHFIFQDVFISPSRSVAVVTLVTYDSLALSPGVRNIAYFELLVKDTGTATIDTFRPNAPPDPPIVWVTPDFLVIKPIFIKAQFDLTEQNIKPGDANGDNVVNLMDIIYFVNYLFKNGPEPVNKQLSDVNVDCSLNLKDLIFLVNYVFRDGSKPLPGCID